MRAPRMTGVIDRRLLVNYRVDPDAVRDILPGPLRPQLVNGVAVAGICLLRLTALRPAGFPAPMGLRSENAAHRIAVEWDDDSGTRTGVFVPRRDSGSRVNVAVGGRLFPGPHGSAEFTVEEAGDRFFTCFTSRHDGSTVSVRARAVPELRGSEIFADATAASRFFQGGNIGWSPNREGTRLDGLELRTSAWSIEAGEIDEVHSTFFEGGRIPAEAAELDSVLVMRRVPVTWVDAGRMTLAQPVRVA